MHHFINAGLYDALFIMQDTETKTLWNHITGEALYGELAGHRLVSDNLLQMNAGQALQRYPEIQVAISDQPYTGQRPPFAAAGDEARLMDMFSETLGTEDTRQPRMEMGLGVWSGQTHRFYPSSELRKRGKAVIDTLDGRRLLIYLEPVTSTPAAIYVDAGKVFQEGKDFRLDDGSLVRSGRLIGPDENVLRVDRPQQIFTRWYGFSLTFPQPEIYGTP